MTSKARSALKRAFRATSKAQFHVACVETLNAVNYAAMNPAYEGELQEIIGVAANLLRYLADIADKGVLITGEVSKTTEWAAKGLMDPFFTDTDERRLNPRRA